MIYQTQLLNNTQKIEFHTFLSTIIINKIHLTLAFFLKTVSPIIKDIYVKYLNLTNATISKSSNESDNSVHMYVLRLSILILLIFLIFPCAISMCRIHDITNPVSYFKYINVMVIYT